jgi:hypothetical protein
MKLRRLMQNCPLRTKPTKGQRCASQQIWLPMSQMGHKQTSRCPWATSALPPKVDVGKLTFAADFLFDHLVSRPHTVAPSQAVSRRDRARGCILGPTLWGSGNERSPAVGAHPCSLGRFLACRYIWRCCAAGLAHRRRGCVRRRSAMDHHDRF